MYPTEPNVEIKLKKITNTVAITAKTLLSKKNTETSININIDGMTIGISAKTIFGLIYS